jgi:hypothetical protein
MINKLIFSCLFLCLFIIFIPNEAKSTTYPACDISQGSVSDNYPIDTPTREGACQSPATYYEFFFQTFLVCDGFPILGTLSNCQDMEITPSAIKITNDSTTSLSGTMPLPGEYNYSVSIVGTEVKVAGSVEFTTPQMAGAAPGTNTWSFGQYCQQKPDRFVFSEVSNAYDWNTGNTYCQNTPFTEEELTPSTMVLDDFTLGDGYLATNHSSFDPTEDHNVVVLNQANEIAQNAGEAEKVLIVQKMPQPLIIRSDHTSIEFTYSLERGLANYRTCPVGGVGLGQDCLLGWFWMGTTNATVRTY